MGLEANFKPKHQLGALHLCRKGQILLLAESWDRWLPTGASAAAAALAARLCGLCRCPQNRAVAVRGLGGMTYRSKNGKNSVCLKTNKKKSGIETVFQLGRGGCGV